MICPNCQYSNPDTNRYCGNCGNLLSLDCPKCGAANPPFYEFCGNCGFPLSRSDHEKKNETKESTIGTQNGTRQPESSHFDGLKGERRIATVLVADVKKSTELLTRIGSEAWVNLMSKLLQVMEAQIYRYEGQVDQFRGDGLIAFFGVRGAHEDDPERAVLAGLAMQEAFEQYKWEFEPYDLNQAKLRIGINTDELIVARIGTEGLHREETAMGEAIALAARLESAAEPGTVLVSESTQNLTLEKFHWMDLSEIDLKGIPKSQHVYRPIAVRSDTEILQELQTFMPATPLIGRYEEFDLLRQKVDQVMDGVGDIVLIAGERGLGKSFLVHQVYQNLHQRRILQGAFSELFEQEEVDDPEPRRNMLWLQGWCSSYERSSPFFIWQILIKSWLGNDSNQDEQGRFIRLEMFCQRIWPENYRDHLIVFASLLSILPDELSNQIALLDIKGYLGKVYHSIREWLVALSQKTPLVISLRSIQWVNSASFELLRDMITLSKSYPILWLVDYRPGNDLPVQHIEELLTEDNEVQYTKIVLHPLDVVEAETLVEYILQPKRLEQETLNMIIERAEGNPYFIQELLSSLIDEGMLVTDSNSKFLRLSTPIHSINLPDSLQSLFLSRIDKLSTADRLILQMASVIGYLFWTGVIEAIAPEEIRVESALENLVQAGFIEIRSVNMDLGTTYAFTSTLIRDVAYENILSHQKLELHAQIADFLRNFIDNQEISSSLVAYHYQMGGNPQLELLYRIDAAVKSSRAYANDEAYQEYSRALTILDFLKDERRNGNSIAIETQQFELVKERIEVLYHLGRVVEAQSEARRLLSIADRIPDEPVWRIDALLMQPSVNFIGSKEALQEGIPQAQEALELSREIGDSQRELLSLAAIVHHRILMNDPTWKELGDQAISIAEDLGDDTTKVDLLLMMDDAYGLDELEQGLQLVKNAYTIVQVINYKGAQVELLYWLGAEFERSGDYVTLLQEFEEKRLQLSQELGWRLIEARSLMFMGQIAGLYLGEYEKGLEYLDKAESFWRDVDFRVFVFLRKAQVLIQLDHLEDAWHYLELARPLASTYVHGISRAGFELVQAIYQIKVGTLDSLMRAIGSAKEVLKMVEEENLVSRQYRIAAYVKTAQANLQISMLMKGKDDLSGYRHYLQNALESSKLAMETYSEFGFTQIIEVVSEEIFYTYGTALLENDQHDKGEEYISKAYEEMSRKLAMIPQDSHYRESFMKMSLHDEIIRKHEELI